MFKKLKNVMNRMAGGLLGLVAGPLIGMMAGVNKAISIVMEGLARIKDANVLIKSVFALAAFLYITAALPIGMVVGTINGLIKGVYGGLTKGVLGAVESTLNLLDLQPIILSKGYIRGLPLAERKVFFEKVKKELGVTIDYTEIYREARIPFSAEEEEEFNNLENQEKMAAAKIVAAKELTTYATLVFKGHVQPGSESSLTSLPPELIFPILKETSSSFLSSKETDKVIVTAYHSVQGLFDRRKEKQAATETTPLLKEYELSYSR